VVVNSDMGISDAQSVWLEELFTSPVVFWDSADHGLVRIMIATTSYQIRKNQTDGMYHIELEFRYTYSRTRQRG